MLERRALIFSYFPKLSPSGAEAGQETGEVIGPIKGPSGYCLLGAQKGHKATQQSVRRTDSTARGPWLVV